jgi:hypothetical protein
VSGVKQLLELSNSVVAGIDGIVVGDVIPIIPLGGRIEGEQPDHRDAELLQVVKRADKPGKISHTVSIGISESLDVYLIYYGIPVPEGVICKDGIFMAHIFFSLYPLIRPLATFSPGEKV